MIDDFNWFVENYDQLYEKYGHKFLAIKNKTVIGVYDDIKSALECTLTTEEHGSFIIQECDGTEDAYTNSIVSWCFA